MTLPDEPCRIGVTGHRFLADLPKLREGVAEALNAIAQAFPARPFMVLSSLAEGADRLVAEAVLQRGGTLTAVLPFQAEEYERDFTNEQSLEEFRALLGRAVETVIASGADDRSAGYSAAGMLIVQRCDVLIALWDGEAAQGAGGTAEIVEAAQSLGKPIAIIRTGNRRPGTDEATSLGVEQGHVLFERM